MPNSALSFDEPSGRAMLSWVAQLTPSNKKEGAHRGNTEAKQGLDPRGSSFSCTGQKRTSILSAPPCADRSQDQLWNQVRQLAQFAQDAQDRLPPQLL